MLHGAGAAAASSSHVDVLLLHSTASRINKQHRTAAASHWKSSDVTADTGAHADAAARARRSSQWGLRRCGASDRRSLNVYMAPRARGRPRVASQRGRRAPAPLDSLPDALVGEILLHVPFQER